MPPAVSASRAGVAPKASGDRSSRTFGRNMKLALAVVFALPLLAFADIPSVPDSDSPDGKLHAVIDIDRDLKIQPELKEDSFPRIEITEKMSGKILASIEYFGSEGDDARPLREHVSVHWRPDSKAFSVTIDDRFYSSSAVFALNSKSKFVKVEFPSYKTMTGFPEPNSDQLKPRGRSTVEGWDKEGRLIYYLFMSPLASYEGNDPLEHRILLEVTSKRMIPVKKDL